MKQLGVSATVVPVKNRAEGIAALEPDLAGRYGRGLFYRQEAHVDPIAAMTALLVSPRGSYVTGTTINVDGGVRKATL